MIVADNTAYDYKYEQYIYDLPVYDEKEKPIEKKAKKTLPKSHIFSILLVFFISIIMISRYAYIAEITFNINRLERQYNEVIKENSLFNVKLAQTVNLQTLEKVALEELGMQYPDSDQIIYVNVKKPIAEKKVVDKTYFLQKDVLENKYVAKVKTIISSIISFLD